MSDMVKDVVELDNGLKVELFRRPEAEVDFPWGEHGELIQDMSKILTTDTSRKLYQSAQIVTQEGVEIPLFPSQRDDETSFEMMSNVSGYMVNIDKKNAQIRKKTVYDAYGYEVAAATLMDLRKKGKDVEVHEIEMNNYYRNLRIFESTYINGRRQGKETEYNSEKIKIREAEWKNGEKDGEEVFFGRDSNGNNGIREKRIWSQGVRKQKIEFVYEGRYTDEVSRLKEYKREEGDGWFLTVNKNYKDGKLYSESVQKEDLKSYPAYVGISEYWDTHFVIPVEHWEYDKEGELAAGYVYRKKSNDEFKGCLDNWYKSIKLSENDVRFIRKKLEVKQSLNEIEKVAAKDNVSLKDVMKLRQKRKNFDVKDVMMLKRNKTLQRK